jgi:NAD(P)-dependent dehydrogenase (short-subunit alcohol dehydrogenase family)
VKRLTEEFAKSGEGRVIGAACDVRRPGDVDRFADFVRKEFGGADALVNSAGTGRPGKLEKLTAADVDEMIDTNLKGVIHSVRAFLPLLRSGNGALVVNIGSVGGKRPGAGHSVYCASKFGVAGFSQALARELRPDGIRVCHLVPGGIQSAGHPAPSLLPADITEAILYLLSTEPGATPLELELVPSNEDF